MNAKTRTLLRGRNLVRMLRRSSGIPFPDTVGTFMGRDALALAISLLELGRDDTVLLPAYLCAEVLRPFDGRVHVEFYDVMPDLTVDPETIRERLNESVKVVLVIDYFGFLQPYRHEIKAICEDNGVWLIEDCAHSVLTQGAGDVCDLGIYSFRKLFPVPDGGGLRLNIPLKTVASDFYPGVYSSLLSVLVVLRSIMDFRTDLLSRAWFASRRSRISTAHLPAPRRRSRTLPLSRFSANGIGHAAFPEIIERRRADFLFWRRVADGDDDLVAVFEDIPEGVCPLGFPVRVRRRDSLRARLDAAGIQTTVEWRLPRAVGPEFVNSHQLSTQMLTLPLDLELGAAGRRWARESMVAGLVTDLES